MNTKFLLGTLLAALPALIPDGAQAQESSNLPDEYLKNLKNYEFVNTRGMKDLAPNRISWIPERRQDQDNWVFPSDDEIKTLKEMGINFPDFEFLEGGEIEPGQKRQQTHTVEHIIYAMPGDAVSLYPLYGLEEYSEPSRSDFKSTLDYYETFSHWYDYKTGGRLIETKGGEAYDLLDFPHDRQYIQITDNYGFYGGIYMSPGTNEVNVGKTYEVASVSEYINAVKDINNTGKGTIKLTADLDFAEKTDIPLLGTEGTPFLGIFDGNGYTISNLEIKRDQKKVGLISVAGNGAAVYNLTLDNCTISGQQEVGIVGYMSTGALTAKNIKICDNCLIQGTTTGEKDEHFVGAILGRCENKSQENRLTIEDVYVGGKMGNPDTGMKYNTVLCGWLQSEDSTSPSNFKNIVANCTLTGPEELVGAKYVRHPLGEDITTKEDGTVVETRGQCSFIFYNCYGNFNTAEGKEGIDIRWKSFETNNLPTIESWANSSTPGTRKVSYVNLGGELLSTADHRPWTIQSPEVDGIEQERRKAGTSAVFYFPESLEGEWDRNKEYVIAADFSQTFEPQTHINVDEMTVTEPLIVFRHIFRIRDAHELTGQLQNNNNSYVRSHQHKVTARIGSDFQIRLDSPLATEWGKSGGVTNYYYKNGENYDRISQFGIKVLDGKTHNVLGGDQGFYFGADIRMRRATGAGNHATPMTGGEDGHFRYHTMLKKGAVANEEHYIVQIIAKDNLGNAISTSDGDMVLMQYDIHFLPESGASLVSDAVLYAADKKFEHARDEYLKEKYGEPADQINFDNYFQLNQLTDETLKNKMISYSVPTFGGDLNNEGWYTKDNLPVWDHYSENHLTSSSQMHHSFYKWPISWERSTYGFGYNYRYNYNMYMLATHSTNVPYHAIADRFNDNIDGEIGLYDRLYYKTRRLKKANPEIKQEQGYFYYVNAASDPGVSARLNFSLPCPGSRVIVSAWVAEMTKDPDATNEQANLSFNIVAVKNTGERVTLHNFITGYIPNNYLGQWCNVYYTFVPRLAEFNLGLPDVDHFELELAHNGETSVGADYAIDDIRAYVVPPMAEADHFGYACDDTNLVMRVETSFDTLMEKSGGYEAFGDTDGDYLTLYYAFVDKEKYDANPKGDFTKYVVKTKDGDETYNSVTFNSNFNKHSGYIYEPNKKIDANGMDDAHNMTDENGDRLIVFDTDALAGKLRVGKEYYVVFKSAPEGEVPEDLATFFDLKGDCSYNCVLVVKPSLKVKFDGEVQEQFSNLQVCENSWPVIQLNVWSTDTERESVEVDKNAYFDWFDGSINEFEYYRFTNYPDDLSITMEEPEAEVENPTEPYLKYALNVFRQHYWDAENVTDIKYLEDKAKGNPDIPVLEQWMLDIIDVACASDQTGRKRLLLHNTAFVLSPKDLEEGKLKDKSRLVAIPIVDLYPDGDYESVCPSPTEIGVNIAHRTPALRHGLTDSNAISYPSSLNDVPLRLGLRQLRKSMDGTELAMRRINVPIREASSSDGLDRTFKLVNDTVLNKENIKITHNGAIVLAQTNDPEYKDLGSLMIKDDKEVDSGNLLWIGEIKEFAAATPSTADGSQYFIAQIYDEMNFKEGYYYRMRFRFEEQHEEEVDADAETICKGQDVFTIKVVPEYMQWNGDKNLSWDNDDNWRRISSADILKENKDANSLLFTDGANNNRRSYAPLGFTKVVIDRPVINEDEEIAGENPWLYAPKGEKREVKDDYTPSKTNDWTFDPARNAAANEPDAFRNIGGPTSLIQYDMTAFLSDQDNTEAEVRCRPWTANNCDQIHFLSGSTIMNQQELNYAKAWVDIELDHSRWYLLSTPLQDVCAGDFYLPTANARQETELFNDITFDTALHNRFAPAVYQRGWDKSEAKVYELGKQGSRNAVVKTFWSHVYNDVTENYGEGKAFSIKTDISKVTTAPEKVLFRLPKADETYLYFNQEGDKTGHSTAIARSSSHRLNESKGSLTTSTANAGKYFLIGNPFMTHFNVAAFLKANSDKLQQRYWVVTKEGQIAVTVDGEVAYAAYPATDAPQDPSVIAPMQGIFVEAINATTSLSMKYDETMMRHYDVSGKALTETTRSDNSLSGLKISSFSEGRPCSAALLIPGMEMEKGKSVDAIDNRDLDVASTVYTAKDGRAMSINLCDEAEGVEIGVIADPETETTLIFEWAENLDNLFLADREENTITPLDEVKEIKVKGAVAGRFYLTSGSEGGIAFDCLEWNIDGNILNVADKSASGMLCVTVCDTLGRVVAESSTNGAALSIALDKGVFVVKMATKNEEKTIKINL